MSDDRDHRDRSSEDEGADGSLVHPTDTVLAVILLTVMGALWYATEQFEEVSPMFTQNVGPDFFPRLLLVVIVALTLVLPFEHRLLKGGRKRLDKGRTARIEPLTYVTALLLGVIVLLMPYLGTTLTIFAVCVLLPLLWGERRVVLIGAFAVLFPIVVTIVFNKLLSVYFEPGPLAGIVN